MSRLESARTTSERRGAVAVFVALMLLIILGFVGLAIDSAYVLSTKQELQAAADAGSMAATRVVQTDPLANDPSTPYGTTRNEAIQIALQNTAAKAAVIVDPNYSNAANGDVVVGIWDSSTNLFTPNTTAPNAVQVTARRSTQSGGGPLGLVFGRLFNKPSVDISRTAISTVGQADDPWILILDPAGRKSFALKGTPAITVPGGTVHINSSAPDAFYMNGAPDDPRVTAGTIRVFGGAQYPTGSVVPLPITDTWVEPDYLMYLPDHPDPTAAMPNYGSITSSGTYDPGNYPGGIDFTDGVANLNSGVYVIGPPGIKLTADAQIHGVGVMLFIDEGATVDISGQKTAGMDLTAPTSGIYEGIVFYQHRQNTNLCDVQGGGLFDLRGTMYLKNAELSMDGNVHREVGKIVVFRQLLRGTGTYNIPGLGPPSTQPKKVFLVE